MSQSRFMVLDARDEHQTDQEIADFLGVSVGWVNEVRKKLVGDKKFTTENFITGDSKREIAKEYIQNNPDASQREVAENTPVSQPTVGTIKKELEEESESSNTDTQTDEGSMD